MLNNKYATWYNDIVNQAKSQENTRVSGYFEEHHILPKSLGGSNERVNIVKLTAREHYLCHWLLTKTTTGAARTKMIYAFWMMNNRGIARVTTRTYEYIKTLHAANVSKRHTGLKKPRKSPVWNKGKTLSETHKANLKKNHKGTLGHKYSQESREKMRLAQLARWQKHRENQQ